MTKEMAQAAEMAQAKHRPDQPPMRDLFRHWSSHLRMRMQMEYEAEEECSAYDPERWDGQE